jgi:DNA-binding beta-propeller fold protein YncE
MMKSPFYLLTLLALAGVPCPGQSAPDGARWPGLQPDGSVLLHNQWSLHPVGRQVELGNLPVNIAVHPQGQYAAVLHSGFGPNEVIVADIDTGTVASRAPIHEAFYGIAFSSDGRALFCSGAGDEVVQRFDFLEGKLTNETEIKVHDRAFSGVPCGLTLDRAAKHLFVANVWGDCVSEVELGLEGKVSDFMLGVKAASTHDHPKLDFGNRVSGKQSDVLSHVEDRDRIYPYGCCLDEKRQRLYVSFWAQAAVGVIDLKTGQLQATWPTEEHPCEMVLTRSGKLLYVANANRNTVTVFDTADGHRLETIWAAFFPDSPPGATPNSLALSPDEKTLYVANANVNAVAVFDVGKRGESHSWGFIPVGWYPTSVRVTPDGRRLLVANAKGLTPKANPQGPYIASLYQGTLGVIDLPDHRHWDQQMAAWTSQAYACTPLKAKAAVVVAPPAGNPIPSKVGDSSPIKYVIYIIKENRTYDQILGDMPQGNGAPKLCLFPERVTPNNHKLARDFVLLDNFYVDGAVSSSGHEWCCGAYCNDFVEKVWHMSYGAKTEKFQIATSGESYAIGRPVVYLWDQANAAGVSYRSYGEYVGVTGLAGHSDPLYRGWDPSYSDLDRVDRFIAEFKRLDAADQMPRLQIIALPNDHTQGDTASCLTPTAYIAQNDLALGRLVEAVSHSRYWAQTAIFVVEDDSQDGPDHVEAHRTTAYVASPYARRSVTDSTMYSTTSMVRTIELILGLKPMSQFDAAATPMYQTFQAQPDLRPYNALSAMVDLKEKNKATAWGAHLRMNFAKEDAADPYLLNEVIWKSVRGGGLHHARARSRLVYLRPQGRRGLRPALPEEEEIMTKPEQKSLLTRRAALRKIGLGTLFATGMWPGALKAEIFGWGRHHDFKFIEVNDLHIKDDECGHWLEGVVKQMKQCRGAELCLVVGDIADDGKSEHLGAARDILRRLDFPYYPVIGNHDYLTQTDRTAYVDLFPSRLNYHFEHKGWQFVAVDSSEGLRWSDTEVSAETLRWLDDNLPTLSKKKPTILFTHFPLGEQVNFRPKNADAVLERFREFNLQAVFDGHFHGLTERKRGNTTLTTNRCCALKTANHDGTKEKGYFLCTIKDNTIGREFVECKVP